MKVHHIGNRVCFQGSLYWDCILGDVGKHSHYVSIVLSRILFLTQLLWDASSNSLPLEVYLKMI